MFTAWKLLVRLQCGPPTLLALVACSAGCAAPFGTAPLSARAFFEARAGLSIGGVALLTQDAGELRVAIDVVDAPPGVHGVHVHDAQSCAELDALGPGRHYNPERRAHGDPRTAEHSHAGDLGNIEIDAHGNGHLEFTTRRLSIAIGERDIVRRVITISEARDDFTSQPFGASGPFIACAVICEAQ